MDAIILAGALNNGLLQSLSPARYEAEIEIAGRPMLDYIVLALKDVDSIGRIVVIGPETALSQDCQSFIYKRVQPGKSMVDSLLIGLDAIKANGPVMVVTSDIPLINKEAVEDFLENCTHRKGDVYYSFISKESCEEKYPGVSRTYVKLKDGVFTGGNIALISEKVIKENMLMLKKAVMMRKNPLQLCSLLGWKCFLKLISGNLTIANIEARIAKIFGFIAIGVVSTYPEIGIDVDKPSDLSLAKSILANSNFKNIM